MVDGRLFRIAVSEISKFHGMLNEGDIAYFENVTSLIVFWQFIHTAELEEKVLKP